MPPINPYLYYFVFLAFVATCLLLIGILRAEIKSRQKTPEQITRQKLEAQYQQYQIDKLKPKNPEVIKIEIEEIKPFERHFETPYPRIKNKEIKLISTSELRIQENRSKQLLENARKRNNNKSKK